MKAKNKKTNIVGIIIALMMVFLCAINVTYAYFTTQHSVQSTGNFPYMSVMWYIDKTQQLTEETTISITPSIDKINRGDSFTFENTGAVSIYVTGVSAYVRFWVDAYVVTDVSQGTIDTSQNFGKYFELDIDANEVARYQKASNNIYYMIQPISNSAQQVASSITFALNSPDILMTKTLQISISFDAVQAQNKAYKKVFDDSKGYYADWE